MPNKYIRHGVAFNGDGTTPDIAASDGAPGAWNTLDYFSGATPAYGTLSAGDTVYVKTTDETDSDITINLSAATTLGITGTSESTPVIWVFDDGTVWSGLGGTITYVSSATTHTITFREYTFISAYEHNLVFRTTYSAFAQNYIRFNDGQYSGIYVDTSSNNDINGTNMLVGNVIMRNIYVKNGRRYQYLFYPISPAREIIMYNLIVEVTSSTSTGSIFGLNNNYSSNWFVYGGELFGSGVSDSTTLARTSANCGPLYLVGFKYPYNVKISTSGIFNSKTIVVSTGADGFVGDAFWTYSYAIDSRDDGNYPTLNATLEDTLNTTWSYKLYPFRTSNLLPARVPMTKSYILTASTKTITVDFLWPSGFATAPDSNEIWVDLVYTSDVDGRKKYMTSRTEVGTTLGTSTATWSTDTYGATSFTKYKIAITTLEAIKQNTEILLTLFCNRTSASESDVLFVCPDFQVT